MSRQNMIRSIACITAAGLLLVLCNITFAGQVKFPQSRYTPPANVIPSPQPPKQSWADGEFYKWATTEIIKAFQDGGLEVEEVKPAYTIGPVAPREATMFVMPTYGENIGGYLSSYNSEEDFEAMKEHYLDMNKGKKSPAWWVYEKDNILVLISGKVPAEKASMYEKTLIDRQK